MKADIHSL